MKTVLSFVLWVLCPLAWAAQGGYLDKVSPGSRLYLNQGIAIPAHTATVYFQGGRVVSPADLDEYYPHCLLLSRVVGQQAQPVPAGEFEIRRVFRYDEEHSRVGPASVQVAGSRMTIGDSGNGGRTTYYFTTRLTLASTAFPNAMYFECRHLSDYAIGDYIRLAEFEQAVGPLWSLHPPR